MEGVAVELPTANFATPSTSSTASSSSSPPPFLSKTYDMVVDPATDSIVSWSTGGNSFVVWNVPELARDVLPKYFKHNNFSSFVRQLNTYGFRKVDSDRWEFANEGFLRGQKHLLKRINRRKPTTAHSLQQEPSSIQSAASKSCVEVGKFGVDEEVDRLKRDKNVLMQELVRLRQHQQTTDKHLQTVGQRVQVMEQRQQQMMSFLAKAMHSPGFLAQLVQQQNESSQQHITGINKKRRYPNNDEDGFGGVNGLASDGQVIKFQPLINEAAKSMLRQISKLNASPRREQSVGDPNAFLIDGFPPPIALDSGYCTAQNSGVTLAQMPTASGQVSLSGDTALPAAFSSVFPSDSLLPTQIITNPEQAIGASEVNMHNKEQPTILPDFDHAPEVFPESSVVFSDMTSAGNDTINSSVMDTIAAVVDETVPVDTDELSPHLDLDGLLDSVPKLPGSNDAFWEQFFSSISSPEVTEDNSCISEGGPLKERVLNTDQPVSWDKIHQMSNLTEQMGLLSAERKRV
ncbi:hypothetical protein V2J09_015725 [Rumex salicifolius]